jgi:hypothetical protein
MLRRVALVRTDVSEEFSASFIRVTRIGGLGTLAVSKETRLASRCLATTKLRQNISQYSHTARFERQSLGNENSLSLHSPFIFNFKYGLPDAFRDNEVRLDSA